MTNVGLDLEFFQSNQSGIETLQVNKAHKADLFFQSNQSGIETHLQKLEFTD